MAKEYTKEKLWKLYEKLPEELKEAVFSETTADNIFNICTRSGIEDDRISEIAKYTGRVLMGVLPIEDFQKTLEEEIKLEKEAAKSVAREIFRFVFYPVKTTLEELYNKTEIAPPIGSIVTPPSTTKPATEGLLSEDSLEKEAKKDTYREPLD